jgi:alcohol dehydrogenase, propanol-preferring
VVVIGVGGLGHMAVQLLRETSGATIIAVDTDEARLRQASELGAHHAVVSDERAGEEILGRTRERGADVVFDFVGAQPTLDLAAAIVASLGIISVVGLGMGEQIFRATLPPVGLPWGASVIKPYGGMRRELHDVVALARQGRIAAHIERHPLEDAAAVLESLERGEVVGRAVLVPGPAG